MNSKIILSVLIGLLCLSWIGNSAAPPAPAPAPAPPQPTSLFTKIKKAVAVWILVNNETPDPRRYQATGPIEIGPPMREKNADGQQLINHGAGW